MPLAVTTASLPRAFELVKGMQAQGLEWGESYRVLGRRVIAEIMAVLTIMLHTATPHSARIFLPSIALLLV